ncbi:MAG: acyl carrier protein [Desulfovibrio sp.]|jgi:acyl carrier protein|nr:acyl carrier protein [Desulfovibrio sp.]
MQSADFLVELQELLQCDIPLSVDTALAEMEEWDSLAVMSCVAYLEKHFGMKTKISQYKKIRTVADLIALAGGAIR